MAVIGARGRIHPHELLKRIPMKPAKLFWATLLLSTAASGADGDIDTSFGLHPATGDGFTIIHDAARSSSGRIVAAGQLNVAGVEIRRIIVMAFDTHGRPDPTFGIGGQTLIDFNNGAGGDNEPLAIAVQADGKVLVAGDVQVAGSADTVGAIARLNVDGSPDATFGGNGKTLISFDQVTDHEFDAVQRILPLPDGKIFLLASSVNASGGVNIALARLAPDGTRDTTFDFDGRRVIPLPAGITAEQGTGIARDAANRLLIGGNSQNAAANIDMVVLRVLQNGQLDTTFGAGGRTTVAFDVADSRADRAEQLLLQPDGKIVLVGQAVVSAGESTDFAVARINPDGGADATFGVGGRVLVPFDLDADGVDGAFGAALQGDGKLIAVGAALRDGDASDVALARLDTTGNLDNSFGFAGKTHFSVAIRSPEQYAPAVFLQNGRPLLAIGGLGIGNSKGSNDLGVVRLQSGDLVFADGFD